MAWKKQWFQMGMEQIRNPVEYAVQGLDQKEITRIWHKG